jgi:hypothetical protein
MAAMMGMDSLRVLVNINSQVRKCAFCLTDSRKFDPFLMKRLRNDANMINSARNMYVVVKAKKYHQVSLFSKLRGSSRTLPKCLRRISADLE